jgi:Putative glycosyl hydrolase domain
LRGFLASFSPRNAARTALRIRESTMTRPITANESPIVMRRERHLFVDTALGPVRLDLPAADSGASLVSVVKLGTGGAWLDPWDTRNHDMIIAVAREAQELGSDEIQLDYIRLPVDAGTEFASYPHEQENVRRRDLLHDFLGRLDEAVSSPIGVDVFGIQAFWEGDSGFTPA